MAHWKIFSPDEMEVTAVVPELGDTMFDVPLKTLHVPFPIPGMFPVIVNVGLFAHKV